MYKTIVLALFTSCVSCKQQPPKAVAPINAVPVTVQEEVTVKQEFATDAPNTITRNITEDKNGNIWLATFGGIIKYDGSTFTNITKDVSSGRFFSILEDRKGNFWFGSIGDGAYYYDGTFTHYTKLDGLISDEIPHLYEDRKGDIWFGTLNGLSVYNGSSFRNFTREDGLPNNDVNVVTQDTTGTYWIGTRGDACLYDGKSFTVLTKPDATTFKNVRTIIKDKSGNIWLSGQDGLWKYNGSTFTQFSTAFTGHVYEDKAGNMYTTAQSTAPNWTLSKYDKTAQADPDSKPKEIFTEQGMLFGIFEDSKSNIWVGSLNGVLRYDGTTITDFK